MQVPEELKTGMILAAARRCLPQLRKHIELVEKFRPSLPIVGLVFVATTRGLNPADAGEPDGSRGKCTPSMLSDQHPNGVSVYP